MKLIDGNATANLILNDITNKVAALPLGSPALSIAFIRVGDDPASISYVQKKQNVAAQIGFKSHLFLFPTSVQKDTIFKQIDALNADPLIHGILIQAPLPPHLPQTEIFNRVSPQKDVDGFTSSNLGKLLQDDPSAIPPCTPSGILHLLQHYNIPTQGKHVVIVGRSLIVSKPTVLLLLQKSFNANATVTICHSFSSNLPSLTSQADVLITAIGKPLFITKNMVKPNAAVIDVGINRIPDPLSPTGYKIVGDVDFPSVAPITSFITPVPGGVGPMTVAMLMKNTFNAFLNQSKL